MAYSVADMVSGAWKRAVDGWDILWNWMGRTSCNRWDNNAGFILPGDAAVLVCKNSLGIPGGSSGRRAEGGLRTGRNYKGILVYFFTDGYIGGSDSRTRRGFNGLLDEMNKFV